MKSINISGGIIGAVIGAICAGPLGALIGGGLGLRYIHFDTREDDSTRRLDDDPQDDDYDDEYESQEESRPFLSDYAVVLFFRCLGKLAKSDGRVSEDEAEFVRELMRVWEMDPAKKRRMGTEFNHGRDSSRPFLSLVTDLANTLNAEVCSRKARRTLIQILCSLVVVDREVHPAERRMLNEAGRALGVQDCVEAFFADAYENNTWEDNASHTHRQSSQKQADAAPQDPLQRAYDLLGIPPTATDSEVKSAYRRKAKEFHPDRAEAAGLSAAFIQRAKEQFQELGNAYDTIRDHRGMK